MGTRLEERHIITDPKCKRCGLPESITHLFFHCDFAKTVWQTVPFVEELDSRGMIELRELWNYVKTKPCLPPTGITSGHLAPWIMWEIWTARNKLVFSNLRGETGESLSRAIRMAREWQEGQTKETQTRRTSQPKVIIDTGTILRTDAAWNEESSRAGLGWILTQDEITSSLAIIAENVPSPLMAEGLALREALQKSRELGIKVLNVESDSKNLIASATNNKSVPELYGIVADIMSISCFFDYVSFKWIPREANYAADLVAKQMLVVNGALMTST